jgi:hypothetical protein
MDEKEAGPLQEGGLGAPGFSLEPIVIPGRERAHSAKRDLSQREDLASLLSCPAPGRPLHLEGEAADPL